MSAVVRTLGQSSVAKSIYACCLPADVEGLKPVAYSLFFIFIFLLWKEPHKEFRKQLVKRLVGSLEQQLLTLYISAANTIKAADNAPLWSTQRGKTDRLCLSSGKTVKAIRNVRLEI